MSIKCHQCPKAAIECVEKRWKHENTLKLKNDHTEVNNLRVFAEVITLLKLPFFVNVHTTAFLKHCKESASSKFINESIKKEKLHIL